MTPTTGAKPWLAVVGVVLLVALVALVAAAPSPAPKLIGAANTKTSTATRTPTPAPTPTVTLILGPVSPPGPTGPIPPPGSSGWQRYTPQLDPATLGLRSLSGVRLIHLGDLVFSNGSIVPIGVGRCHPTSCEGVVLTSDFNVDRGTLIATGHLLGPGIQLGKSLILVPGTHHRRLGIWSTSELSTWHFKTSPVFKAAADGKYAAPSSIVSIGQIALGPSGLLAVGGVSWCRGQSILGKCGPWYNRTALWLSADGRSWQRVAYQPKFRKLHGEYLAGGSAGYLLGGGGLDDVWHSTDGVRWTRSALGGVESISAYENLFVATATRVQTTVDGGQPEIRLSPDGQTWELVDLPSPAGGARPDLLTASANLLVAIGESDAAQGIMWWSEDGHHWQWEVFDSPTDPTRCYFEYMDVVVLNGVVVTGDQGCKAPGIQQTTVWVRTAPPP